MKKLNKSVLVALLGLGTFLVLVSSVTATPLNVTMLSGSPVGYVGLKLPDGGPGDFGDPTVLPWGQNDVAAYNTFVPASLPPLSTPLTLANSSDVTTGTQQEITFNLTGNFNYVVLHWGKGHLPFEGGVVQIYYLGGAGLSGLEFPIPTDASGNIAGGFSGAKLYPSLHVPEAASTWGLLGLAVGVMEVLRRQTRRA